ncbi:hypothetical protein V5E97_00090 [Singulisphaera sp. Ch08]|uniref:PRC-barrel domain-containing protein n=1 Tax=Singulisphaera sp. Ch08 TaxID=3120278 RepID=A0AAU7CG48_9BACT
MRVQVKVISATLLTLALAAWQLVPSRGQQPDSDPDRFNFVIVESFDAKYLGDSPGHFGRGKIGQAQPDLALGDPVFRKDSLIGKVTGISWDRVKENLEVEFDPEPFELDEHGRPAAPTRVAVGESLWIPRGGKKQQSPANTTNSRPQRDTAP